MRALEAVSLVLNLGAFYMIVSLNKKLFRDPEKGGYGLKGVATLTFFQYITSWVMLRLSGVKPKPFEDGEWKMKLLLIVIFGVAPLASNMSLLLNPVATYQLFKLLQTPLLAVVEVVTGFRDMSPMRGVLMLGVMGGVAVAELGEHWAQVNPLISEFDKNGDGKWTPNEFRAYLKGGKAMGGKPQFVSLDTNNDKFLQGSEFDVLLQRPSRAPGLIWASLAVVLASSFKMFTGKLVRRGMTPAQFLLNLLPYSGMLLFSYAVLFEQETFVFLFTGAQGGGLGSQGMATFVASGLAAYFVQFTQAVAVGTTSALSHALIGQAKTASMLLLSPIIFGEDTTMRQLLGGGVAMLSLVFYAYVNVKEIEAGAANKSSGVAAGGVKAKAARGRSPGTGLLVQVPKAAASPKAGAAAKKAFLPMTPHA